MTEPSIWACVQRAHCAAAWITHAKFKFRGGVLPSGAADKSCGGLPSKGPSQAPFRYLSTLFNFAQPALEGYGSVSPQHILIQEGCAVVDLDKPSHRRFAESWYARVLKPSAATRDVDRYLDMANAEEMRGNFKFADEIRRFALNSP